MCNIFSGHVGFSTNWREKGLHFKRYAGQTNKLLQHWMQEFENLPITPKSVDISGKVANNTDLMYDY